MFADEGDPVKDADVPDEETETRQDNDDDSDSLADARDQFRKEIEYPLSPFGSLQVNVVTEPLTGPKEVDVYEKIRQIQKWVDRYDKNREGKGYPYWEINCIHSIMWLYQRLLGWGSVEAAKCPNMPLVMLFGWAAYKCNSRIIPKATRLRSDIRDGQDNMMQLIYKINEHLFQGQPVYPVRNPNLPDQ
jgi:hypothetical protein